MSSPRCYSSGVADIPKLVTLHVSPWSERVKWAFDHHGLAYKKIEHVPMLGEPRLRRLVRGRKQLATVPIMVHGETVLVESWDITKYADSAGSGSPLIPAEREAEIRTWNDLADETMSTGRALVMSAMLESPRALDESLPHAIPLFLRILMRPISRFGAQWFSRKYDLSLEARPAHEAKLRGTLDKLRAALRGDYLLGTFTYADIVMAVLLQAVKPVGNKYIKLGPATEKVWTIPEIAEKYKDLLAWRDELYAKHRRKD